MSTIVLSGAEKRRFPHAVIAYNPRSVYGRGYRGSIHLSTERGEGAEWGRTACGRDVPADVIMCPPRIFDPGFKLMAARKDLRGVPLCKVCAKAENPETGRAIWPHPEAPNSPLAQ
jgi:hypothetical protein